MVIKFRRAPETVAEAIKYEQDRLCDEYAAGHLNSKRVIGTLSDALSRKTNANKTLISLRLDPEVIQFFRNTGEGWQTRINAELRKVAGLS